MATKTNQSPLGGHGLQSITLQADLLTPSDSTPSVISNSGKSNDTLYVEPALMNDLTTVFALSQDKSNCLFIFSNCTFIFNEHA